ncbi:MAG TPA: polysaccharide biosynthesis C-terminal domain-containing protein, partial [bacterium]|nr:polysaccharide biosynthesis C-terminal domain-containing protein [bacterium]
TGSVGILLVISGNEKVTRNRSAAVALFGLFLNLLLVPKWGMVGAAVSTALCVASSNLISAYFVWSKLGIWTLPFPRWVGKRP